jgi:hypothetical protein
MIATGRETSVVVSWKTDLTASVTAFRTSVTSAVMRETIWPARCRLKNDRSSVCMCAVSSFRRSVITRWPIQSVRYALPNPSTPRRMPRPITARTAKESAIERCSVKTWSNVYFTTNGTELSSAL